MDESMITRVQKGEDRVVVIMDRRARSVSKSRLVSDRPRLGHECGMPDHVVAA
jgi:hypothetical protein